MNDLTPQDPNPMNRAIDKTIEESIKAAKEFLDDLVGPSIKGIGGILGDQVNYWRLKHTVNLVEKTKSFLEKKKIKPTRVPLKTLFPIVENGSLEEEEDMRSKWSAMLANAADPSSEVEVRPSYPQILKELSPLEVKILDDIYEFTKDIAKEKRKSTGIIKEKVIQAFNISSQEYDIIADNLFRLNLCQPPTTEGGATIGKYPIALRTYEFIQLTTLGTDFVKACKY